MRLIVKPRNRRSVKVLITSGETDVYFWSLVSNTSIYKFEGGQQNSYMLQILFYLCINNVLLGEGKQIVILSSYYNFKLTIININDTYAICIHM